MFRHKCNENHDVIMPNIISVYRGCTRAWVRREKHWITWNGFLLLCKMPVCWIERKGARRVHGCVYNFITGWKLEDEEANSNQWNTSRCTCTWRVSKLKPSARYIINIWLWEWNFKRKKSVENIFFPNETNKPNRHALRSVERARKRNRETERERERGESFSSERCGKHVHIFW